MASGECKLKVKSSKVGSLLVVEDNPAMVEMLVDVLRREYVIAGTVSEGASVVSTAEAVNPDVILLDISLGDMSGFDVARRLRKSGCTAKIVFVSVHENQDFVRAAFELGASGYVFKSQISPDLLLALKAVSHGEHFLPTGFTPQPD